MRNFYRIIDKNLAHTHLKYYVKINYEKLVLLNSCVRPAPIFQRTNSLLKGLFYNALKVYSDHLLIFCINFGATRLDPS